MKSVSSLPEGRIMKAEFNTVVPFSNAKARQNTKAVMAAEFSKLITSYKEQANAEMLKRKQDADEKAAAEAKKKKEEKINELIAMIAQLRARIGSCSGDASSSLEAQLGQLEGELLMLLLFS